MSSTINQMRSEPIRFAATQTDEFPERDQAVVIESRAGLQLRAYVAAVGLLVEPANVRFASRMSNGRICIFLASKEIAENLVSGRCTINVGMHALPIRSLITKHRRIVVANACPSIPHSVIEDYVDGLGVRRGSSVAFIKAGIADPEYEHVMSSRRYVYVHQEDVDKLPESFQLVHGKTRYWIYLTEDALRCYVCKQHGHAFSKCTATSGQLPYRLVSNICDERNTMKEAVCPFPQDGKNGDKVVATNKL